MAQILHQNALPIDFRQKQEIVRARAYTASSLTPVAGPAAPPEPAPATDPFTLFPTLPPLHCGPVEAHLRHGILQAARDAAAHEPDAEKAFFVADLSKVLGQHAKWSRCLPEIVPFYAIKCNPDPYVLRLLAALGTGFDCASLGEINQVLSIGGIDPSRIIFANPCKANSFIRQSANLGVDTMTFDNADELHKIAKIHKGAKLVVRILTDDSKSLCRLGLKFGAALAAVPGLLSKAKELGLDVIGVSFHIGSGSYDPAAFGDAIARARAAFDMGAQAGYDFTLLDVGGGFEDAHFEATATGLRVALDLHFPVRDRLRIIAEPGRFFVATAFTLATNIIARRGQTAGDEPLEDEGPVPDEDPKVMYYVNDGVYGSFNCILFDHQVVHPYPLTLGRSWFAPSVPIPHGALQTSSVWGPTCDSIDCISKVTLLPRSLEVGDWLGFENMGAYTVCAASRFNGFDTSRICYTTGVGDASNELRQTLERFAAEL
jgi:ornithine decarboxylase